MRSIPTATLGAMIAAVSAMMALSACMPMAPVAIEGAPAQSKQGLEPEPVNVIPKDELSCIDDKVDYDLRASVDRFEMSGSGGAGFNPGALLATIGLNFSYETGELQTSMTLYEAFKTKAPISTAAGTGSKSDFGFGLNFLQGLMGGGFNFYTRTPVYTLTNDALTNNLNNIITALTKVQTSWSTTIVDVVSATEFVIPVGSTAGVMIGDEFNVVPVAYDWAGTPCQSELRLTRPKTDKPIATAVVKAVEFDNAYLVVKGTPAGALEKHAFVTISKLAAGPKGSAARKSLSRSLRVSRVTSKPLTFKTDTGTELVDMAPLVWEQLKVILRSPPYSTSFYLRD